MGTYATDAVPTLPVVPVDDLCTGFGLAVKPASITVPAGAAAQTEVEITSLGGFSDVVDLRCVTDGGVVRWAGLTCTFAPNPVYLPGGGVAGSTLTVGASPDTPEGIYTVWVEGESRGRLERALLTVTVTAPDPTLCVCLDYPMCREVAPGCFYWADLGDVDEPFFDAFTIVTRYPTGAGEGAVPYLREFSVLNDRREPICDRVNATRRFHQIWFAHRQPLNCMPPQGCVGTPTLCTACCNVPQNYFHLVGSSRNRTTDENRTDAVMGLTMAPSDVSLIFGDAIEQRCTGCNDEQRRNVYRHVTAHEIAHQFRLNKECQNEGHDDNAAWCGQCAGPQPLEKCMMHLFVTVGEMQDGINRLDCYNLIGSMAHPTCREDVGSIRCGEVLRTTTDPK